MSAVSFGAVHSGQASADWLVRSNTVEPGKALETGIRVVVDEGWHTYWENPGEGGMKLSVTWDLPAGWTAGELRNPVPKRFMTGDLPGFGYVGTAVFPVTLTAPADFKGEVKLKGKVSWLTCNEERCVPGAAELEIIATAGAPVDGKDAPILDSAMKKVPKPADDRFSLTVSVKDKALVLTVSPTKGDPLDPENCEVFPVTQEVVDPAARFEFKSIGGRWVAEVSKSEYAEASVKQLTLVFAPKSGGAPVSLSWKAP